MTTHIKVERGDSSHAIVVEHTRDGKVIARPIVEGEGSVAEFDIHGNDFIVIKEDEKEKK